jgi:hypothetical protein
LVATMLRAPIIRMAFWVRVKFRKLIPTRIWLKKYSELVDRESAYDC